MPSRSCGRVEDVGLDPSRRGARRGRQAGRKLEHPRAEVHADDLVRAGIPERQRVAAAGALEVDRPPAAAVEVADQVLLDGKQVRAAGPDQRRPPRRTSPRTARRPRPRPRASRRASRARPQPPPASRGRTCDVAVSSSMGGESTRVHGRPGHTEAVIHRTTAHRIVPGPGADTGPVVGRRSGSRGPDRRLSRRGRRSRCFPRGGWSPRSRLRAMRLRSPAAGGTPASAVASRALGPFASSSPGPPGDLRAGRRSTPRLSPRRQLPARAGRPFECLPEPEPQRARVPCRRPRPGP